MLRTTNIEYQTKCVNVRQGETLDLKITEKIEMRFDELEARLRINGHLGPEGSAEVALLVASITKFTSILSDEQRDFVNSARCALDDQLAWA